MERRQIQQPRLIFWDFDGVIKESIEVKTLAFGRLFESFGEAVVQRVREHHEMHGGMSRFEKVPLYLEWAGVKPDPESISEYCDRFGQFVLQGVIAAAWVPGAENYLRNNAHEQTFILVSATPQDELEQILHALDLDRCFAAVFGAPTRKKDAIRATLESRKLDPLETMMIGDARADLEAARENRVSFLLRRHATNAKVFEGYTGSSIHDFTEL